LVNAFVLVRRVRVGSRLKRIYDQPQTPLDRLSTLGRGDLATRCRRSNNSAPTLDLLALADTIERKLKRIQRLARRQSSLPALRHPEREVLQDVSRRLDIPIVPGGAPSRLKRKLSVTL